MSDKRNKSKPIEILDPEVLDAELGEHLSNEKFLDDYDDIEDIEDIQPNTGKDLIASDNTPAIIPSKELTIPTKERDALTQYIKEISRYEQLSLDEEKRLTKLLSETGDIRVAKKLVLANLRLVVKIAMEYKSAYQNVMDLIQEGNIGLMKAVSKYSPDKGAKLSYYASWWIKSYILKFILDNFRLVKIGTTNEQKKLFFNLMREKEDLSKRGIKPDAKVISENLGVSEKAVLLMDQRLDPSSGGEVSIDAPLGDSDEGGLFADLLGDEDASGVEDIVSDKQSLEILQEHLKSFVDGLKERDQEIFKKRLLSEVPPSLQSIADDYGISRERVRQIEERLLNHLKVYMSEHLR